jgi:hypothetical protein
MERDGFGPTGRIILDGLRNTSKRDNQDSFSRTEYQTLISPIQKQKFYPLDGEVDITQKSVFTATALELYRNGKPCV